MDNYMKNYYKGKIATSETKIKIMTIGIKNMMSDPEFDIDDLCQYTNAITDEKNVLRELQNQLNKGIFQETEEKENAKRILGLGGKRE